MTREELISKIQEIEDRNYYKRSQFLIDFFEGITETYINADELPTDEVTFLGAFTYSIDTILEIMNKTLDDYTDLCDLLDAVNERLNTLKYT